MPKLPSLRSLVCFILIATAAGAADAQNARQARDKSWARIQELSSPTPSAVLRRGERKSQEQRALDSYGEREKARQTAEAARAFYTAYPRDNRAPAARKIEALYALRGAPEGDDNAELAAQAVAQAYRADTSLPEQDRFEVALAAERRDLSARSRKARAAARDNDEVRMADRLRAEFGDSDLVANLYLTIGRSASPRAGAEIARQVLSFRHLDNDTRKTARLLLERADILGRQMDVHLNAVGGGKIDLSRGGAKNTVLIVWPSEKPETLAKVEPWCNAVKKSSDIVFVALNGNRSAASQLPQPIAHAGRHCYLPPGRDSRELLEKLKVRVAPYVYVLDRQGRITDFGALSIFPEIAKRIQ